MASAIWYFLLVVARTRGRSLFCCCSRILILCWISLGSILVIFARGGGGLNCPGGRRSKTLDHDTSKQSNYRGMNCDADRERSQERLFALGDKILADLQWYRSSRCKLVFVRPRHEGNRLGFGRGAFIEDIDDPLTFPSGEDGDNRSHLLSLEIAP